MSGASVSTASVDTTGPVQSKGTTAFQVVRLAAIEERDQRTGIEQQLVVADGLLASTTARDQQ